MPKKKKKETMAEIELEFISSEVIKNADVGKIAYIIERIKANKILVIEESLTPQEEARLIEETMEQVDKKFPGIEVSTLRDAPEKGVREKIIKFLGGKTGGLTVVGPSRLVKKIKKEPQQISLFAEAKK